MEQLLHTPEGVRDIYDAECKKKKKVISHSPAEQISL